jgi:mono/diheme cytochrome c family protein
MSNNNQNLHGVLGEFESVDQILAAAEKVKNSGYTKWDCYTPMPVHGLDQAMGVKETRLPWVVLVMGITGAALGLLMQYWMNGVDYKMIISGKPMNSLPASIPVIFETTILFASLTSFFCMWIFNGLPKWFSPLSRVERFARATDDRFFVAIAANDPNFDVSTTSKMLENCGAAAVELVEEPDESSAIPLGVKTVMATVAMLVMIPLVMMIGERGAIKKEPRLHLVPDMDFQEKFRPQSASGLFADGRAMRPQLVGTFALEDDALVGKDPGFYTGKEDGEYLTEAPIAASDEIIARGKERYGISCAPCHNNDLRGKGPVHERAVELGSPMWVQPTDLYSEHLAYQPVGQWFESISNGVRNMPGYAKTVSAKDRWAIVQYLKSERPVVEEPAGDVDPAVAAGRLVFMTKTCSACHTENGTRLVGPTFKGFWGSERELEGGTTATADEAYLRESLLDPNAKVAKGYPPAMVAAALTDQEIADLIVFLESIAD